MSAALLLGAVAARADEGETILTPVPSGFKISNTFSRDGVKHTEWAPATETAQDWSRMVTEQIFYQRHADPDVLPKGMTTGYAKACPGSRSQPLSHSTENGYAVAVWQFECPLNPATQKPENMWIKVISGADNLYDAQYAYRLPVTPDRAREALDFLKRVRVCDTRTESHPCPRR